MSPGKSVSTLAGHAAVAPDLVNRPASPPIFQSAAWEFSSLAEAEQVFSGAIPGAVYGTRGVPNVSALEAAIAELEGANGAVVTSGGSSAIFASLFAHLRRGERIVASIDLFGGTIGLLRTLEKWGIDVRFVDLGDPDALATLSREPMRVLFAETISNPRMRVSDIAALASVARRHGALLMVDNTFATPFHCQPLALGADIVIESVTKGIAGHFDVVLGTVAGREEVIGPIRELAISSGMIPSAFDAWLATRGLATFALRQQRAALTAARLAAWMAAQSVRAVHYPGLPTHREDAGEHALARRILERGYGSVLSFELGVDRVGAERFVRGLALIRLVHSLGGTTTTLSHSLTMTHRHVEQRIKDSLGLHDGFFRLSVGLEDPDDLEADLERALRTLSRET